MATISLNVPTVSATAKELVDGFYLPLQKFITKYELGCIDDVNDDLEPGSVLELALFAPTGLEPSEYLYWADFKVTGEAEFKDRNEQVVLSGSWVDVAYRVIEFFAKIARKKESTIGQAEKLQQAMSFLAEPSFSLPIKNKTEC